jgi:hypothetical protein
MMKSSFIGNIDSPNCINMSRTNTYNTTTQPLSVFPLSEEQSFSTSKY